MIVAKHLLHIAEQRDKGIRERVAAGDIPEFEALDNQRAIIERQERVVAAQRLLEQSAIQLSLYWRDDDGQPQLPSDELLPEQFPEPDSIKTLSVAEAMQASLNQRPEPKRLELQTKQTQTELELQQNQRAPAVDITVSAANDNRQQQGKAQPQRALCGVEYRYSITATGRYRTRQSGRGECPVA